MIFGIDPEKPHGEVYQCQCLEYIMLFVADKTHVTATNNMKENTKERIEYYITIFWESLLALSFCIFVALTLVAVRRICLFFQIKFTTFWYLVIPFRLDILIIQLVIGFNANFPDLPIDTHVKCKFVADTDVYIRCYWDPWNVQIVGCNWNVSLFPQGDTLTCKP